MEIVIPFPFPRLASYFACLFCLLGEKGMIHISMRSRYCGAEYYKWKRFWRVKMETLAVINV